MFSLGGATADKIFKQKVNDCVQRVILQKSTNFHAIRSWSFRNICNEIGWPVAPFFAPPCIIIYSVSATVEIFFIQSYHYLHNDDTKN